MKKLILTAIVALGFSATQAQTTWKVDNAHSKVGFSVPHLAITETEGFFRTYDGTVVATAEDFQNATINFSVDATSINTEVEARDKHLKSPDFFNTEKFGKIEFKGSSFKKVSGKKYALTGTLTIKGVTKPVTLDVVYNGTVKDPYGNTKAGFKFTGTIKRTDFGVGSEGNIPVGEEVTLNGAIELQKVEKKG